MFPYPGMAYFAHWYRSACNWMEYSTEIAKHTEREEGGRGERERDKAGKPNSVPGLQSVPVGE